MCRIFLTSEPVIVINDHKVRKGVRDDKEKRSPNRKSLPQARR